MLVAPTLTTMQLYASMRFRKVGPGRVRAGSAGRLHHIGGQWHRLPDRVNRTPRGKYIKPFIRATIHRALFVRRAVRPRITWLEETAASLKKTIGEKEQALSGMRKAYEARALIAAISKPDTWGQKQAPGDAGALALDREVKRRRLRTAIQLEREEYLYWRSNRQELQMSAPIRVRPVLIEGEVDLLDEDTRRNMLIKGKLVESGDFYDSIVSVEPSHIASARQAIVHIASTLVDVDHHKRPPHLRFLEQNRDSWNGIEGFHDQNGLFWSSYRRLLQAGPGYLGVSKEVFSATLEYLVQYIKVNTEIMETWKQSRMQRRRLSCQYCAMTVFVNRPILWGAQRGSVDCSYCSTYGPTRWVHRTPWGEPLRRKDGKIGAVPEKIPGIRWQKVRDDAWYLW